MQRIGGYTKYFNEKYDRNGSLFQGTFKSKHVAENNYLLHLSAYINMNNRDPLGSLMSKLSYSSLEEYIKNSPKICNTEIIIGQFNNGEEYKKFTFEA